MVEWILSSSALILLVLAVRALAKSRLSCRARYALWLLVLARLLVPVQLFTASWGVAAAELPESVTEQNIYVLPTDRTELPMSVLYDSGPISEELLEVWADEHARMTGSDRETIIYTHYTYKWSVADILRIVWLAGAGVMALTLLVSNLRFARRLRRTRVPYDALVGGARVYIVDWLVSPCLAGVFHPTVYLTPPCTEDERTLRHVLAHETTHRLHGDCIWSLLRLAALCLHWYNPLVWLAVVVSKRDGELACDEATLGRLGEEERIPYGETLLSMVTAKPRGRDLLSASTAMTAGKKPMRERIEAIARHPRTKLTALALALAVLLTATVFGFSRAKEPEPASMTEEEALDALEASVRWEGENNVYFTLPASYEPVTDWRIHISGRAAYVDGMSMSVHFFDEEVWEAGREYAIWLGDLTLLTMYAWLPDGDGGTLEREINLLPRHEWYFDLDGDGRDERLTIEETRLDNSADASPVRLYDADGALLEELGYAGQAHAGWATYALADLDSGTYLMSYMPTMFQGEASYSYSLLTVSGGQLVSHTPAEVQFSINPGAENDSAAMAEFQEQANGVWAHSRLLFTTDQEVLSHLYDADTGAAVATNGSYYAASNNETVRYRETMTRFRTVRPQSFDDLPAAQQDDVLIDAGWEPLTADELEAWKETFEWPGLDTADDARIQKLLQISCFFTSHYDTPREIDLSEFLAYFPLREAVEDEMEFAAINARAHFKHKDEDGTVRDATLREMPVPVHRYRVSDINTALTRYAGITLDDMSTDWRSDERMIYLPEYDAFYNFTSDFGLGQFAPERGMRAGSVVRLDGKWSTLRVSGTPEQFQIVSFTGR